MGKYILKRLLLMIPVVLFVAILIFTIMEFVPGDPAQIILGSTATENDVLALREELGLNRPYPVRLGEFLYNTFIKFDFGTSYMTGMPVTQEIMARLPRTLILGLLAIGVALGVGIPLGLIAVVHQN